MRWTGQDSVNRRIYHSPDIPRHYRSRSLNDAETAALLKYQEAFAQRDVLDLGVGTGRTTWYLAPLARRYVGVDYAPAMVRHLRAERPDLDVREADVRDLSQFPARSFDLVLGSCNVLDALGHADRLRALLEACRVLRSRGVFMFSSHNRERQEAFAGPALQRSRNPVTQARYLGVYLRRLYNHARIRHLRRSEGDYALLNDSGHDYALIHYYIDRVTQQRQLQQVGLRLIDVFAASGRVSAPGEIDTDSASLLYVACRERS